jgi:Family of unknown function (DUF5675)
VRFYLRRDQLAPNYTAGRLFVDQVWVCDTLEDTYRPPPAVKVPGKTCIPEGTYKIHVTHSPRFRRPLPLLVDVPDFSGIRIHAGNTVDDTEGCILVGERAGDGHIVRSRVALREVMSLLSRGGLADIVVLNCPEWAGTPVAKQGVGTGFSQTPSS